MKKTICLALILFAVFALAVLAEEGSFVTAADNGRLRLSVNEQTLEVQLEDLANGELYETKVMNGQNGNKTTKNNQKSDMRVYYVVNEFVGTTNSMDSFSMAVSNGNYALSYVENGFEIRFSIGDTTITVDDLPKMVPVQKYYDLLLPYWGDRDDSSFREFYRVYRDTMWVRTDDGSIGKVKLNNLYSLFYEKGKYTREDLAEDNLAYGYEIQKLNPRIDITVRYTLDESDLLVTVPCADIVFTDGNPVTRIDLLPYFLQAGTSDEGYIFVPDGSGSLINLNNGKLTALSYTDRVYGNDPLMNVNVFTADSESIRLPVYGIKTRDRAIFAVIEQGAALATINADISGRSDEFNRVYSSFTLRDIELLQVLGTASGGSPRYPDDIYTDDIVIRYKFLYGDDASYTGMAHAYRDYLIGRGELSFSEMPKDAPLFAGIIGAVRKTKFFAGIPYESTAVATTMKQASVIASALSEAGVKNPVMLLRGYWEGGIKHESLAGMSLESSAGSKTDLKNLTEHTRNLGGETSLVTNAEKVYTTSNFSKSKQASRRQDDFVASVVDYAEPILAEERGYEDSFYVSPAYIPVYSEKIVQNLKKAKLVSGGIALDDLGELLVGDYRNKNNISRVHALPYVRQALETLADGGKLVMKAPNDYAMFCASMIYGLPNGDNGHKVEDASVPFIQLVLDGTRVYCAQPWNESAYNGIWRELNYAVESKSAPYFILSYAPETVYLHTEDMDSQSFFMTQYEQWLTEIGTAYARYNAYWQLVKDARVKSHEVLSSTLRRVTYENGVTAYINYASQAAEIDGVSVSAHDFMVTEGIQ